MADLFSLSPQEIQRVDSYRATHKVSILTLMFSDVVGYTQICERTPESALQRFRSTFDRLTVEQVENRHAGLIVKRIGDAILAIFAQPTSAVLAALDLHGALEVGPLEGLTVQLRTGIHVGQVAVEEVGTHIDVFGRHVNRAARVQTVAGPGEILVTEPVEDNVRGWVEATDSADVHFGRRRTHVLKGLADPITVYSVERRSTDARRPAEDRLPECYVEILVTNGPCAGTRQRFDGAYDRRILIGRSPDSAIVLSDPGLSRTHAMVWSNNDGMWEVKDLGARAGIFVNGAQVEQRVLAAGDRIQVGDTVLSIESIRHSPAQPRPS
jgi:class 3 adenylate cyclase